MDQIEIYSGYNIRAFELSPGKWTAEFGRWTAPRFKYCCQN